MAVKACRSLIFTLLLSLSVVSLTATVGISTVAAAGGGGTTSGDPDSPKDTGPRPAAQSSAVPPNTALGSALRPISPASAIEIAEWVLVQQLLSSLLGRPGLL